MVIFGQVGAAALAFTMTVSAAFAQTDAIPAEFPPTSFAGNQYVDSKGCAFIRAGIGGNVNWVPRLTRSREQMCNFQPTFVATPTPTPEPAAPMVAAAPAPKPTPTPAPTVAAKPTASVTAAIRQPAPRATQTRRAPVRTASAPTPSPRIIAPAPAPTRPPITMAQACAGRHGVQTGFVSQRTGKPINCGPAPQRIAAPTPRIAVPAPVATPQPQRLTMAQICERAAGGTRFERRDGTPIVCEKKKTKIPASNPVGATAVPNPPRGHEKVWNDGRINPQRGKVAKPAATAHRSSAMATGHRYVQVGTFGVPANAQRMIKRLGAMGYPVATARSGHLRVIAAGPFSARTDLHAALQSVRGMGFKDAFTRN